MTAIHRSKPDVDLTDGNFFADGGARYASANLFTEQDEAVLEETLETRLWW